jgi:Porin subfamily
VSFYDFYPAAAELYRAGNLPSEDTGDGGWWVWAYTAQFGGGFSATLSAEERRVSQIIGFGSTPFGTAVAVTGNPINFLTPAAGSLPGAAFAQGAGYGAWQAPDVVGNIRVDQAWGSAQIMGAAHELNPLYYSPLATAGGTTTVGNGHAGDSWGFVVGAGLKVNTPFISPGDYFVGEVNYTQGATRYLNNGANGENEGVVNGGTAGWGVGSDCIYAGSNTVGTGCLETTAWSFNVAYEHYWTPQWHQSIVGAYLNETYSGQANAILCAAEGNGTWTAATATAVAGAGCDNNWALWGVGSRLQWDITKSFYIGVEAIYQHLDTASYSPTGVVPVGFTGVNTACSPATSCAALAQSDQSNWTFTVRMHKDFLP